MNREIVFNHDGYGILGDLARTAMTEQDAADLLVKPLADAGVTVIDWSILSTGVHNCRTRHRRLLDPAMEEKIVAEAPRLNAPGVSVDRRAIARVIAHYAARELDLLDIVIKHGHARGVKVFGNIRLNHANASVMLEGVPGRRFGGGSGARMDFRDAAFHAYLIELCEDLLARGVDGLSLDFERKAPFFPDGVAQAERMEACTAFLRRVRKLTGKPVVVRVAYESAKGAAQGQDPEGWMREGLVDAVVPATHNHEPDRLHWSFERFVTAAKASPRPCAVWPQIWPTPEPWREPVPPRHPPRAIVERAKAIFAGGGQGVYFFNYCCYWPRLGLSEPATEAMFRELRQGDPGMTQEALRAELSSHLGLPGTRVALAPEKRGEVDLGDGVVVEKWLYTAEPGSRIPANLYRPRDIQGRIPAIVMTCGHGDSKSLGHMQYVARTYARAGVACLMADPLGEEERHFQGQLGTREHDDAGVDARAWAIGRPVMGKLVFDAMRGLDLLESLDWIDPARLGAAGNSLGGAVAAWLFGLEPRLRLTIVSGWGFSDFLLSTGKSCTNLPFQKLREACDWPDFLRLGAGQGALLVMNGDADPVIDRDGSGVVWKDTVAHLQAADPAGRRLQAWWCSGGGHRPYQGGRRALEFIHEHAGTPGLTAGMIAALPELHYGTWCDRYGVELEPLYGVELHYRGVMLLDFGFQPIPRAELAVLRPEETGTAEFTTEGWLAMAKGRDT